MKFFISFLLTFTLATVHAAELPLRINSGGPAIGKRGSDDYWEAGKVYVKGGKDFRFGGGHDRSKAENPGPEKIYETVRHEKHRYEIKGLPAGKYLVRFHFTEGFATDKRAMDYKINGKLVIDNLDIFESMGAVKRVLILDVATALNQGETMVIEGDQDKGVDVFEAGLEIIPLDKNAPLTAAPVATPVVAKPIAKSAPVADPGSKAALRNFTGGPARFVWLQGDSWASYTSSRSRVSLMGLDTEDGFGERKILPDDGAYSKPLFTPDGNKIVFSDLAKNRIFMVDWNGKNLVELLNGVASEVWRDPKTGKDWIYLRKGGGTSSIIVRRRIDSPGKDEMVWDRTDNGHRGVPWFQLSEDGRMFSDAFPWPKCGAGDLARNSWDQFENGCWPSISPDNSYRTFVFSGSHTEISVFDEGKRNQRKVAVNGMPEIRGKKVYFPKWTSDPRFITVTGPEKDSKAELYVGKFDSKFRKIEGWAKVTNNSRTELFGDAWFGKAQSVAETPDPRPVTVTFPAKNLPSPTEFKVAPDSDSPAEDKLVWIWEGSKSKNEANDFACNGDLHGRARFGRFNDLLLDHGWFTADPVAGKKIVDPIQTSREFTVEAIVTSFAADQSGPARIVTLSQHSTSRNFTLGQQEDKFAFRVRTSAADTNGTKSEVLFGNVTPGSPQHVLITYRDGTLRCFLDGHLKKDENLEIDFGSWDPAMKLLFGDEGDGRRDWKGRLEGVSIYSQGMDDSDVWEQARAAQKKTKTRDSLKSTMVKAKLIQLTKTPSREEMDSYTRALVENVYETDGGKPIIVRQWAVMDGKTLPSVANRKVGQVYNLKLEPMESHPELNGEFLNSDHELFGEPEFLDVNSHLP